MIVLGVVFFLIFLLGLAQVVVILMKLPGAVRDEVARRHRTLDNARAVADWKARNGA